MTAIFDPLRLDALATDADDPRVASGFAARYRAMLTERVRRICAAVAAPAGVDPKDAVDAVLSLRTSSLIVGATELVEISNAVLTSLRRGDLGGASAAAARLVPASSRIDQMLAEFLEERLQSESSIR